jgi:hypothetical protein
MKGPNDLGALSATEERQARERYSESESDEKPAKGSRSRSWVGVYTRGDGTNVAGHYRKAT